MFNVISARYDLLNDLLSFGIHRSWRKKAVKIAKVKSGDKVLDIATGTGDFAYEFKKATGESGQVTGIDFSDEMLKVASDKYKNIEFQKADALNLQFDEKYFDFASIAFGIRNVDSIEKCLIEMVRVLKPGGKIIILEFGQPKGIFKIIFQIYSHIFMPVFGKLITGNPRAYDYLRESSAKFPCREKLLDIMNKTEHFSDLKYYSLTMGIAYIYIGIIK